VGQQVSFVISDPDTLLIAYGTGALLRVESAEANTGPWAEVATAALVSGTYLYPIDDETPTGHPGAWYRSRVSDAAGSSFSDYSAAFEAGVVPGLLSVADFRQVVRSELPDEALQFYLDSEQEAIEKAVGPLGSVTELYMHSAQRRGGDLLMLHNRASSIQQVIDCDITLEPADYILSRTGLMIRRLNTGPNPAWGWGGWGFGNPFGFGYWYPNQLITVTYTRFDDTLSRKRVQLHLVKLDLNSVPGLQGQTVGEWSEKYPVRAGFGLEDERQDILAALRTDEEVVIY
jgi:hypothetical protein